jgi:hypothetical protein
MSLLETIDALTLKMMQEAVLVVAVQTPCRAISLRSYKVIEYLVDGSHAV